MKRGPAIAVGVAFATLALGGTYWYQAERGHSLLHAALAGRDEPIRLALSAAPGDAGLWELLGEAYANQSRYVEAVQAYDRALSLAPGDENTLWMKGIAEVCRENAEGVHAVSARLDVLNPQSAAQFRTLAKNGCCAFGRGCGTS